MKEKMKILIVDDEQDYCDVMEMIFASHGYQAEVCSNGEEALEKLEGKPFDLVLTDLMMPRMDGTQLLQQVKKKYPNARIEDIEDNEISAAFKQGISQMSNVNPVTEMVNLIQTQRMVETYQKVMTTHMNDLNSEAISKLASVRA